MRFQVPQFIETETKLIGPFTLKQFLWIAGGGATVMLLFVLLRFSVYFFALSIPSLAIFLSLAFVKVDGLPLMNYTAYFLAFALNPHKYTYLKESGDVHPNEPAVSSNNEQPITTPNGNNPVN